MDEGLVLITNAPPELQQHRNIKEASWAVLKELWIYRVTLPAHLTIA